MTPLLTYCKKKNQYVLHSYKHDAHLHHFGQEAVEKLALDARQVFKTLLVELNGNSIYLIVAITPVSEQLNLKRLASTFNAKKAEMVDPQIAPKLIGYLLGGISPLGQKNVCPLLLMNKQAICHYLYFRWKKRT